MKLNSIYINRADWGKHEGRYTGHAEFGSDMGKIQVNLSPETSDKVLALLADQLVASAQETAKLMTAQVISTAVKQLENAE
jgi:hypothetical protein